MFSDTNKGPSDVSIDACQGPPFTMNTGSTELDQFFNSTLAAGVASSHPEVTLTAVKKVEDSDDGKTSFISSSTVHIGIEIIEKFKSRMRHFM